MAIIEQKAESVREPINLDEIPISEVEWIGPPIMHAFCRVCNTDEASFVTGIALCGTKAGKVDDDAPRCTACEEAFDKPECPNGHQAFSGPADGMVGPDDN